MDIIKILIPVCFVSIIIAIFALLALLQSRQNNRELKEELEGTYLIRNIDLVVNGKTVKVTYCVPYQKRNESKKDQTNTIRSHLEINEYGKSNFNEKMVRDHLRTHGFRAVRLTEIK